MRYPLILLHQLPYAGIIYSFYISYCKRSYPLILLHQLLYCTLGTQFITQKTRIIKRANVY